MPSNILMPSKQQRRPRVPSQSSLIKAGHFTTTTRLKKELGILERKVKASNRLRCCAACRVSGAWYRYKNRIQPRKKYLQMKSRHCNFSFPAEWHRQEVVWLALPTMNYELYEDKLLPLYLELIKNLSSVVKVNILTNHKAKIEITKILKKKPFLKPVRLISKIPYTDIWMRDHGPIFLLNSNNNRLKITSFKHNEWGYGDTNSCSSLTMTNLASKTAKYMKLPLILGDIIYEGGSGTSNGKGIMISCKSVIKHRNPNISVDKTEKILKKIYGLVKIIWLKEGAYSDQHPTVGKVIGSDGKKSAYTVGTGGHIDEFVKFIDDNTILLSEVTKEEARDNKVARINRDILENAYNILRKATNINNKKFTIKRIPEGPLIYTIIKPGQYAYDAIKDLKYEDGSIFPKGKPVELMAATSYVNFLITNNKIIGQSYWDGGMDPKIRTRDMEAKTVLSELFPKHEIVTLKTLKLNSRGGGIHCITQQQPMSKKYRYCG